MITLTIIFTIVASFIIYLSIISISKLFIKPKTEKQEHKVIELGKHIKNDTAYVILSIDNIRYYLEIFSFKEEPKFFVYDESGEFVDYEKAKFAEKHFKLLYKEKFDSISKREKSEREAKEKARIEKFKSNFITYDDQTVKDILE